MTESSPSIANPVTGPLTGIKVLDMSRVLAAPWAAQLLADMGAEVIKVERPVVGDDSRRLGPYPTLADGSRGESTFYMSANRGKRSITIDIARPAGQELIRKLAAECDVLVENYKVGDLARYGLDYESICKVNPSIVYCSVTGFGQVGPYAPRPGYDPIFQAMSGIMSVTGAPPGMPGAQPTKIGNSMSDMLSGLTAAAGICGALVDKMKNGRGRHVDVALLDSSFASLSHLVQWYLTLGQIPPRRGSEGNGAMPAGLYGCGDGKDIMVSAGNDAQWQRLAEELGIAYLITDPRFLTVHERSENRRDLSPLVAEAFMKQSQAYWIEALDKAGVPAGPVNTIPEVLDNPQARVRKLTVKAPHPQLDEVEMVANPIRFSGVDPDTVPLHPPMLGEHTDLILTDFLHLGADEIAALRADGIV